MNIIIISPAGSGSKGDEAMMRGLLSLLPNSNIIVLNPQLRSWQEELLDLAPCFQELPYSKERLTTLLLEDYAVAVIGADVIDGSSGLSSSILLLEALEVATSMNSLCSVFFSFRSDPEDEITQRLEKLSQSSFIHFFPRDQDSEFRFKERFSNSQTTFFPDLSFYCPLSSARGISSRLDLVEGHDPSNSSFIALNFSEQSFRASGTIYTQSNRRDYIKSILTPALAAYPQHKIRLFCNDIRGWEDFLSDYHYALIAREILKEIDPTRVAEVLHPATSFTDNIEFLRGADVLITGRMHLSIAAFRAGVIPVAITGKRVAEIKDEKQRGMLDKARGMFYKCIGNRELVLTNPDQLWEVIPFSEAQQKSLHEALKVCTQRNEVDQAKAAERLFTILQSRPQRSYISHIPPKPQTGTIRNLLNSKFLIECNLSMAKHEIRQLINWGLSLDQEILVLKQRCEDLAARLPKKACSAQLQSKNKGCPDNG